jgi:hypothetical protein
LLLKILDPLHLLGTLPRGATSKTVDLAGIGCGGGWCFFEKIFKKEKPNFLNPFV